MCIVITRSRVYSSNCAYMWYRVYDNINLTSRVCTCVYMCAFVCTAHRDTAYLRPAPLVRETASRVPLGRRNRKGSAGLSSRENSTARNARYGKRRGKEREERKKRGADTHVGKTS